MIALRTYGTDDNTGSSDFCSIPVPVGVRDGDLVVVAITVSSPGISIAAPDGFELITRTDPAHAVSVAVYSKIAFSEQTRWVFELDATDHVIGGALVYAGADWLEPIEASAIATSPSSTSQNAPAVATSVDDEEVIFVFGASSSGTFSLPSGYTEPVTKSILNQGTLSVQRTSPSAGAIAATTRTFSSFAVDGASVALVVRPGVGKSTIDDVRERLVSAFPRGVENVYDLTYDGDYYKLFQAIAASMKTVYDIVDTLRVEASVQTSRLLLSAWEGLFGLSTSRVARGGTVAQRQAQVTTAWRAAAGENSSLPSVQSAIAPILGYSDAADLEVVRCSRSALELAHSYSPIGDYSIAASSTTTIPLVICYDGGVVSSAGARLNLLFSDATLTGYSITLTSPNGTSKTWNRGWTSTTLVLYGAEFAGVPIQGTWTLAITRGAGGAQTLYNGSTLFAEGVTPMPILEGVQQNTAGAAFHWAVYADDAHLGENGSPADIAAAARAVEAIAPAHSVGTVITSTSPYPDAIGGANAAIPGRCIPK